MSWLTTAPTGIVISKDVTKSMIGQQRIDFESPEDAIPRYVIHSNVLFFGVTTRTTTEYRGMTQSAAMDMVNASGAQVSVYAAFKKQLANTGFWAEMLVEKSSKTTSARRADASGQYVVTVVETSTTLPGATEITEVS